MLSGIREQLIITTARDQKAFQTLLGDGSRFGMSFEYAIQESPRGLAESFIIGRTFDGRSKVALALGDNLFHGSGLGFQLKELTDRDGATIFAYKVSDPQNYGVIQFDSAGKALSLEEKPAFPKSNFAVPGLYFYENSVLDIAVAVKPSERGELEITSVNQEYLLQNKLNVQVLPRGTAWLDTGTPENLLAASTYVKIIEARQGFKIACLEEIAWRNKWISDTELVSGTNKNNDYQNYLESLLEQ
jgi:glucose-1-phosphate thymidylyltransferase